MAARVASAQHPLLSHLPAPIREHVAPVAPERPSAAPTLTKEPPPYGTPERRVYLPRRNDDFGGGGAFPEIHVVQYPLDMGRKDKRGVSGEQTLALTVGEGGGINYDALIRQGANRDKWIATEHSAMVPKIDQLKDEMAKPEQEDFDKTAAETAAALNLVVNNKIAAAQPKTLPAAPGAPQYIKYTPSQQGPQYNSGASHRIIRMQNLPIDPMEPPKFRHKKVPRGTGSPPVPVMHSPPRPVTVKDQQDWKIPPCISNWKNAKGYTIPLDKRLAADGRGLQEVQINDAFAKLAESLYVAESKARESVEMRQKVIREQKTREKEAKEAELRELAMRARQERVGGAAVPLAARAADPYAVGGSQMGDLPPPPPLASHSGGDYSQQELPGPPDGLPPPPPGARETPEEREARRKREEIRMERARERERERRLEARDAHGGKRSKLTRDRDRDIGEKIALGQANVGAGGEVMYDQRLFNQEQGMGSGLASDDTYNLYDKALFADRGTGLFRPTAAVADEDAPPGESEDVNTAKFRPDKGFSGTDYGAAGAKRGEGPVQFEKEAEDPFGLDQFISTVNKGKKGALDGIGRGGGLAAGGGGGSYEDYAGGGSGRRVDYERGRA